MSAKKHLICPACDTAKITIKHVDLSRNNEKTIHYLSIQAECQNGHISELLFENDFTGDPMFGVVSSVWRFSRLSDTLFDRCKPLIEKYGYDVSSRTRQPRLTKDQERLISIFSHREETKKMVSECLSFLSSLWVVAGGIKQLSASDADFILSVVQQHYREVLEPRINELCDKYQYDPIKNEKMEQASDKQKGYILHLSEKSPDHKRIFDEIMELYRLLWSRKSVWSISLSEASFLIYQLNFECPELSSEDE